MSEKTMIENEDLGERFDFLAGYTDEDGQLHKSYTLKEMTGKEEEAIHKSDVKGNSAKVMTRLLAYCCTSIGTLTPKSVGGFAKWEKIIKNLYGGDLDCMMLSLRKISLGDTVKVSYECSNCKAKLNTEFDLDELEEVPFKGLTEVPFELPRGYKDKSGTVHSKGVMRLMTNEDREFLFPFVKSNPAHAETFILGRLCTFEDGYPFDETCARALVIKDRRYLLQLMQDNAFGINTEITTTCSDCGEEIKVSLQSFASDFFI